MSHTPSPWGTYYNRQDDIVVRKMTASGLESHVIAHCKSGFANAILIAAAPELLEALKALLDDVGSANSMLGAIKARAAIKKAEGV